MSPGAEVHLCRLLAVQQLAAQAALHAAELRQEGSADTALRAMTRGKIVISYGNSFSEDRIRHEGIRQRTNVDIAHKIRKLKWPAILVVEPMTAGVDVFSSGDRESANVR